MLRFCEKKAGLPVQKLLDSAIANAVNNHQMDVDALFVKQVTVDQAATLKRWRPRAMGRATRINKRSSHVMLELAVR
jgi:large subunit ribosomal protein L22